MKNILVLTLSAMLLAACTDPAVDESPKEENGDGQVTENVTDESTEVQNEEISPATSKEDYLDKLNAMEEADKKEEAKTTTVDMIQQEEARLKRWDEALNEIYEVLKTQLTTDEMEKLRIEQLDWLEARDVTAKEASLKFQGGSMEPLEYVATQATLTKDRCYEVVAEYME